jgi:hypothetical protein
MALPSSSGVSTLVGPVDSASLYRLTVHQQRLAPSIGPTRVDAPEDEGRAIPRNVVVEKLGDDGGSPKFKK